MNVFASAGAGGELLGGEGPEAAAAALTAMHAAIRAGFAACMKAWWDV